MTASFDTHVPVMRGEVVDALRVHPDGAYCDLTFGRGGHAAAIMEHLGPRGRLVLVDKDPEAIAVARQVFGQDPRVLVRQGSFTVLRSLVEELGLVGGIDGVLLDLGVSSPQLDDAERGFSFRQDGPLDMRMDPTTGLSAADWLAKVDVKALEGVLRDYGEERYAKRIARAVVQARREAPIVTTRRLAQIVAAANPAWEKNKDPATRTFQAIRIYINNELDELQQCLHQAVAVLAPHGRLAVISFHSLEDRIVKRFIRDQSKGTPLPAYLPVREQNLNVRLRSLGKPIRATEREIASNPRARSAILRVAERMKE